MFYKSQPLVLTIVAPFLFNITANAVNMPLPRELCFGALVKVMVGIPRYHSVSLGRRKKRSLVGLAGTLACV